MLFRSPESLRLSLASLWWSYVPHARPKSKDYEMEQRGKSLEESYLTLWRADKRDLSENFSLGQLRITFLGRGSAIEATSGSTSEPTKPPGTRYCTFIVPLKVTCQTLLSPLECMAGTTGLEPATSAVTECIDY